jgi:hypothetical protein
MPCGSVLPLECTALIECSEIYILSGARVYVVYMPTRHNMATFRLYLDKALHISYVETCQRFQGGITFAQNVGDVIRLPSFCPTVVIVTKLGVAAVFSFRRFNGLPQCLQQTNLLYKQLCPYIVIHTIT